MFHPCAFRPCFAVLLLTWTKPIVKLIFKALVRSLFHQLYAYFLPIYVQHSLILVYQDYTTTYSISTAPVPKAASITSKKSKTEPYTAHRALELFKSYADEDTPDVINPEGFERLCRDAEMPLEGARPLIFSWQVEAKEMGKISRDEWVQGMATLKLVMMSSVTVICTNPTFWL